MFEAFHCKSTLDIRRGARSATQNGRVKGEGPMVHYQKSPGQPLVAAPGDAGRGQENATVAVDQASPTT